MPICPQCGQTVRERFAECPFCGVDMATGKVPFPFGTETQQASSGVALGCFIALMLFIGVGIMTAPHVVIDAHYRHGVAAPDTWSQWQYYLLQAVPLAAVVALYYVRRRRVPHFARGLLYSLFISVALELGALVVCR